MELLSTKVFIMISFNLAVGWLHCLLWNDLFCLAFSTFKDMLDSEIRYDQALGKECDILCIEIWLQSPLS